MPPRKKSAHKLLVNLSPFEVALLRYMSSVTQRPMGTLIRDAVRVLARQHPQFNPTSFVQFVKKEELPELKGAEAARDLKREIERFIEDATREPSSALDPIVAMPAPDDEFDSEADFR